MESISSNSRLLLPTRSVNHQPVDTHVINVAEKGRAKGQMKKGTNRRSHKASALGLCFHSTPPMHRADVSRRRVAPKLHERRSLTKPDRPQVPPTESDSIPPNPTLKTIFFYFRPRRSAVPLPEYFGPWTSAIGVILRKFCALASLALGQRSRITLLLLHERNFCHWPS